MSFASRLREMFALNRRVPVYGEPRPEMVNLPDLKAPMSEVPMPDMPDDELGDFAERGRGYAGPRGIGSAPVMPTGPVQMGERVEPTALGRFVKGGGLRSILNAAIDAG